MGMANLQKMAQQMQQEMLRVQDELASVTVEGSAGVRSLRNPTPVQKQKPNSRKADAVSSSRHRLTNPRPPLGVSSLTCRDIEIPAFF